MRLAVVSLSGVARGLGDIGGIVERLSRALVQVTFVQATVKTTTQPCKT
jgi:hypothetical protein